jgi:hypothetical protein
VLGGGYLYWANHLDAGDVTIGRALESGAAVDPTYITGLCDPCGAAVYSHYLYWWTAAHPRAVARTGHPPNEEITDLMPNRSRSSAGDISRSAGAGLGRTSSADARLK